MYATVVMLNKLKASLFKYKTSKNLHFVMSNTIIYSISNSLLYIDKIYTLNDICSYSKVSQNSDRDFPKGFHDLLALFLTEKWEHER